MPLFLSPLGAYVANNLIRTTEYFQIHLILTTAQNFECVDNLQIIIFYSTAVLLIPMYQFIVYPLLHKHISSLIKRAGAGLVLGIVG